MALPEPVLAEMPDAGPLVDLFGRVHTYLRVSVTDRCNFRCTYCMPAEGLDWTNNKQLLSFEEITRLVTIFASMGIRRVRLTGGEPMVRRDLEVLVGYLSAIDGIDDLSMTTNAVKLQGRAEALAAAGLTRINISLDSLDAAQFSKLTRGGDLNRVLAGIDSARAAGLTPLKINAVVVRGENEDQAVPLIRHFAAHSADTEVRFIEYMPWGIHHREHRPEKQLRERIAEHFTLEPIEAGHGGPATHYRVAENGLVVGFISPMTQHFCQLCNRLRLQCGGELRTCLSRDNSPNLRDLMREGISDQALSHAIRCMVWGKVAGHEAHLDDNPRAFEGTMTQVGG